MPRKRGVRYSKSLVVHICDQIAQDISVAELCRSDPLKYPDAKTFSRWVVAKGDEIRDIYENARRIQMSTIDDKYTDMLANPPAQTGDKALDAHNYKVWQTTLNHLANRVARLAPIFNVKYDKAAKVEHSGEVSGPTIVIQSYDHTPVKEDEKDERLHS